MQHKLLKLFYKFFYLKLNLPGKALRFFNMKKDQRDYNPFLLVLIDLKISVFKQASYGCYPGLSVSVPLLLSNSKSQVKFKKCTVHTVHHNYRLNIDLCGVFSLSLAIFLFPQ